MIYRCSQKQKHLIPIHEKTQIVFQIYISVVSLLHYHNFTVYHHRQKMLIIWNKITNGLENFKDCAI